jgi:hypothetical protein
VPNAVQGEGAQKMINFYDDLFSSTGMDGASAPVALLKRHDDVELDSLMDAWFKERRESIECGMFLDRAKRLLNDILGDENLTPRTRRKVRNLIRAIRDCRS